MDSFLLVLYSLPIYQSIILCILLFIQAWKSNSTPRNILGLFLLLASINFTFNLLYRHRDLYALSWLYSIILPLIISLLPLFFLYILSVTTSNFKFGNRHLLHFIPALLIFVMNLPYLLLPEAERHALLVLGFNQESPSAMFSYLIGVYILGIFIIGNIQLVFYLVLVVRIYRKHTAYIESHFSFTESFSIKWTRAVIIWFILFFAVNSFLFFFGIRQQPVRSIFYNSAMLLFTLFIGYNGLIQKELPVLAEPALLDAKPLNLQPEPVVTETLESENSDADTKKNPCLEKHKYAGSSLSVVQAIKLKEKLEYLMDCDKCYLKKKLSIDDIADKLNTNSKYISQVLNTYHQKNFLTFINEYRIGEAKKLIASTENSKYSIMGIALMSGFSSKSAFNQAFKQIEGMTPSEFRMKAGSRSA